MLTDTQRRLARLNTRRRADVVAMVGATQQTVESWLARLTLSTDYEVVARGQVRRLTFANALELAAIAALVDAGIRPSTAAAYAAQIVRAEGAGGTAMRRRRWYVFDGGDRSRAVATDQLTDRSVPKGARITIVIDTDAIVGRVYDLYADDGVLTGSAGHRG